MAQPLKREKSSAPQPGTETARPVRGRSERDLGGRSKRPPRGERSSGGSAQSKSRSSSRASGGQSGNRQRVVTAGGGSNPRRPRDVKAGSGARMFAPLALIVCAIACFYVITSQGDDGTVKTSGSDSSAKSSSTGSASAAAAAGPKRSVYVVKAGDSFSAIAEKQGVDVNTLQELNPDVDPRALQPGQKLKLKE